MRNKISILFFTLIVLIIGSTSILFLYPEKSLNFIVESLNLKTLLNKKVESFIERKINDEDINVEIKTISFLKPDWPHIIKIKLNDINVHSSKQERKSSLKENLDL